MSHRSGFSHIQQTPASIRSDRGHTALPLLPRRRMRNAHRHTAMRRIRWAIIMYWISIRTCGCSRAAASARPSGSRCPRRPAASHTQPVVQRHATDLDVLDRRARNLAGVAAEHYHVQQRVAHQAVAAMYAASSLARHVQAGHTGLVTVVDLDAAFW